MSKKEINHNRIPTSSGPKICFQVLALFKIHILSIVSLLHRLHDYFLRHTLNGHAIDPNQAVL